MNLSSSISGFLAMSGRRLQRRPLQSLLIGLLLVVCLATIYGMSRPVSHDRNWVEHLSLLPHVQMDKQRFSVSPVRDWRYDAEMPLAKVWQEAGQSYEFDQLRRVWLMVEPHPSMEETMAHTLVLFEFSQDRLLGLTIEARREEGESYDAFQGNWGKFELLYVWASARDLLTRRAVMLDRRVQVFPLDITREQAGDFLKAVLAETKSIESKPRHYNTLFSNCTNELAKAARLDWDPAFVTTGKAAPRLHEMGIIPGEGEPFPIVRERASIARELKLLNLIPPERFNKELLKVLHTRWQGVDGLS